MRYFLLTLLSLLMTGIMPATAQTEEPVHYNVTGPNGTSLALDGTLTLPADLRKPVPVVLLIAGSGPTDRDGNSAVGIKPNTFRMLADSLQRVGIAVLRYDKRYSGQNRAQAVKLFPMADHRFGVNMTDATGFIRQLQADKRFSRVIVAGHSEGSLIGMIVARETNVAGFVSIAGPGRNAADALKTQLATLPDSLRQPAYGILDSLRAGRTVSDYPKLLVALFSPAIQPYMISWMHYNPATEIKQFRGPVLIINGKLDRQVVVSEAELLHAARPDAPLLLFDRMTHVLKDADSDSRADSLKTYNDPALPLTPGLATAIARFVNSTAK